MHGTTVKKKMLISIKSSQHDFYLQTVQHLSGNRKHGKCILTCVVLASLRTGTQNT